MPRVTNDGNDGHNGTLLRTVLSKTPLTLIASSDSDKKANKESSVAKDTKDYRKRASALLLHRRSLSVQSTAPIEAENKPVDLRSRRQKSLSHLERLNPLSTSRFSVSPTNSYNSDYSPSSPLSTRRQLDEDLGNVIHHGEVLVDGTGWRKRTEYLVLTSSTLWRFRSHKKAVEAFPRLAPTGITNATDSQPRPKISNSPTGGSESDLFPMPTSPIDITTSKSCIPIDQIIAVRHFEHNKARSCVEIAWYLSTSFQTQSIVFSVEKVNGTSHWLESLRKYVQDCEQQSSRSVPNEHRRTIRDRIGPDFDWEMRNEFVAVPVLLQTNDTSAASYSTMEIYQKDCAPLCYLVVSRSKVYIVPLATLVRPIGGSLQSNIGAFGIISLIEMSSVDRVESLLSLAFRLPQQRRHSFTFTSLYLKGVVAAIHGRLEELRPYWPISKSIAHLFDALPNKPDSRETIVDAPQDIFVRVLQVYCRAWGLYVSSISYSVEHEGENAPRFSLLPRKDGQPSYTVLELLAVLRALRHNSYFISISFANISLDELASAYDSYGYDHVCVNPRIGSITALNMDQMRSRPLLYQEISAIAMTSVRLRRLDFTSCLTPQSYAIEESSVDEKGCGIIEPLYRLCVNQNTNVDWLVLNGIKLRRADTDYVMAMFGNRDCHLRAIELSNCNLDMWSLRLLLNTMPTQNNTLEVINISNNPGRLSPDISIDDKFSNCHSLRMINLSRILRTNEPVSLLPIDIIASWRLEELRLSQTSLNASTIDDLIQYLKLPTSRPLKQLHLDGCGLNGNQISRIFKALSERNGGHDTLSPFHLDISNNLVDAFDNLCASVSNNAGLTSLTWRLLEIQNPKDFVRLMSALSCNRSIRNLDLSQLYLDFSLNEDDGSSAALFALFARNNTLVELNLSANNSRLDDSQLGVSVHKALLGLARNSSLLKLRIEDQAIGAEGAQSLAQVLRTNTTLRELHCERNKINLASFTLLVDALEHNHTLTHLSSLECDKTRQVQSIESSLIKAARPKQLQGLLGISSQEKRNLPGPIADAIEEVGVVIDEHWSHQRQRLEQYLRRNRMLAAAAAAAAEQHGAGTKEQYHRPGAERHANKEVAIAEEDEDESEEDEEDDDEDEGLNMPSLRIK